MGEEELLWEGDYVVDLEDWSPDGRTLLVSMQSPTSAWDTGLLSLETKEITPVLTSAGVEVDSRLSPDGRWIAFNSDESGVFEIYLVPTDGKGRRLKLTTVGGQYPVFAADGDEVVFAHPDGFLYSIELEVDAETGLIEAGLPERLFDIGYINSDDRWHLVSADGERLLVRDFDKGDLQLPLHLVQNWPGILERRR